MRFIYICIKLQYKYIYKIKYMSYLKYTTQTFNKQNIIKKNNTINSIIALYNLYGHYKIQSHINIKDHSLITASIAKKNNENDKVILSSFLHNIGHLILNEHNKKADFLKKDLKHEEVGYRYLKRNYDNDVTRPILYHVKAKRYLCTINFNYYNNLSNISKNMFYLQGGKIEEDICNKLNLDPYFKDAINIKKYGDLANKIDFQDDKITMDYIEKLLNKYIII